MSVAILSNAHKMAPTTPCNVSKNSRCCDLITLLAISSVGRMSNVAWISPLMICEARAVSGYSVGRARVEQERAGREEGQGE